MANIHAGCEFAAGEGKMLDVFGVARLACSTAALVAAITCATVCAQEPTLPPAPPASAPGPVSPAPATDLPLPGPPPNPRAMELWQDKPLSNLKASISLDLPESEQLSESEVARLHQADPLLFAHGSQFSPLGDSRPWLLTTCEWEAPATRHLPLLFEEPNLERLGYGWRVFDTMGDGCLPVDDWLQPVVSAGWFFGRVPLIPYQIGLDNPFEPIYTLGVDRPGSPVPYRRHYLPFSWKGALYQAGAVVGLAYIIP